MRAPDFWQANSTAAGKSIAGLLTPLGVAWDIAGRLRRASVRPYRPPAPVICVGNLVAGGAGKTPVVLSLAAMLTEKGTAVQVVSRGYGGRLRGPLQVDPALNDAAAVGDEPLLIASRAACWIARDRVAGVRAAIEAGGEAILLDDGFQNPSIVQDLSLLVVDSEYGFGNGQVMPAGPLREAAAAGLARADAVVLLGGETVPAAVERRGVPVLSARLMPIGGGNFGGATVVAFAAIGRPEKFFQTLRELGADLVAMHPFPDHHRYAEGELHRLRQEAERMGARLVTTAKDWVRLPAHRRTGIDVLEVEITWRDPAAVAHLLADVLGQDPERRRRRGSSA